MPRLTVERSFSLDGFDGMKIAYCDADNVTESGGRQDGKSGSRYGHGHFLILGTRRRVYGK